ncbi:MAG: adenylosuccinate synthase [Chromatiales bacterium]|nr:adenylosuccinate synthase [Chromatiales bacterium]
MTCVVVVGLQWGDEGKGKIVDHLTRYSDAVVRFQGGHNAGHTIYVGNKQHILHLLPSGALHNNIACFICSGVVLSLRALLEEIEELTSAGIEIGSRLYISDACPLVFECHRMLDKAREQHRGSSAIGTTAKGIGPAYEDKVARRALRLGDLRDWDTFVLRITELFDYHNFVLKHYYKYTTVDCAKELDFIAEYRDMFTSWTTAITNKLNGLKERKANILFEGAQGTLLDIDHGTYPYVTSSNTIAANAACSAGTAMQDMDYVLGISKAYTTRVGNGPFPTELNDEVGEFLSKYGKEKGATTGRSRRCGWLDAVALKKAININGVNYLCLTKIDVLSGLEKLYICDAYEPANDDLSKCKPHYIELEGWTEPVRGITCYRDLPQQARNYIECLEQLIGISVDMISTAPERETNIVRRTIFSTQTYQSPS